MTNAKENEPSSSKNLVNPKTDTVKSDKLRIDFYESGIGDTIIITFPSGGVGIVDAHPSQHSQRPDISQLVANRAIHFVCLTHPHADHGRDLIPILEEHPQIEEFWHTIYDVPAFIYGVEQTVTFPSPLQEFANRMNQDWGEFFLDIMGAVAQRKIPRHLLRSDLREQTIDGVEVHCLGPDESIQNSFTDAYKKKLSHPASKVPDPNLLSAILLLKFGQSTILLGGDALQKNWESAAQRYRKLKLPKAVVLKVPHHGAKNAFKSGHKAITYLDLCSRDPKAKSVLFAGDTKHPNREVYDKFCKRTEVFCLANGTRRPLPADNPLQLQIPGARVPRSAPICNPVVSFEVDASGDVAVVEGESCEGCPLAA